MRRLLYTAAALLALDAVWAIAAAGCASDLSATTPGHDKCDTSGQCAAGYTCDKATNTCLQAGASSSGSTTHATTSASSAGTGGGAGTGGHGGHGGQGGHGGAGTGATGGSGGSGGIAGMGGTGGSGANGGAAGSGGTGTSSTGGSDAGDGGCGDTMTDPANCGSCGHMCPAPVEGSGTPTCAAGQCNVDCTQSSDAGAFHACPVSGGHVCVDRDDPQYCGTPCNPCPGGQTCQGGTCKSFCLPPLSECTGVGCVDLNSNPAYCGNCTTACGGLTPPYCNAGTCVSGPAPVLGGPGCGTLLKCAVGSTFSCSDSEDPFHCGSCGNVCGTTGLCASDTCEPYIFASGSWECFSPFTNWCPPTGPIPYGLCTNGPHCP